MKRQYLPALLLIGVIFTCATISVRRAYEEGRECAERGGVIIELDVSADVPPDTKTCTADY